MTTTILKVAHMMEATVAEEAMNTATYAFVTVVNLNSIVLEESALIIYGNISENHRQKFWICQILS